MFLFKQSHTAVILAFSLTIVSCHASVVDAKTSALMKKVEGIVARTPPLYKVSWKACGVEKIVSMSRSIFNQCLEGSQLVWGPVKEHEMVKLRDFTTGIHIYIFAKSHGCLIMGEPTNEDYYLMKGYPVGLLKDEPTLPNPTADVKIQQLTTKEKTQAIYDFFTQDPEPSLAGLSGEYNCQSKTDWLKN